MTSSMHERIADQQNTLVHLWYQEWGGGEVLALSTCNHLGEKADNKVTVNHVRPVLD